jgi:hypothetical protein
LIPVWRRRVETEGLENIIFEELIELNVHGIFPIRISVLGIETEGFLYIAWDTDTKFVSNGVVLRSSLGRV